MIADSAWLAMFRREYEQGKFTSMQNRGYIWMTMLLRHVDDLRSALLDEYCEQLERKGICFRGCNCSKLKFQPTLERCPQRSRDPVAALLLDSDPPNRGPDRPFDSPPEAPHARQT